MQVGAPLKRLQKRGGGAVALAFPINIEVQIADTPLTDIHHEFTARQPGRTGRFDESLCDGMLSCVGGGRYDAIAGTGAIQRMEIRLHTRPGPLIPTCLGQRRKALGLRPGPEHAVDRTRAAQCFPPQPDFT